jgi:hypothetical protein
MNSWIKERRNRSSGVKLKEGGEKGFRKSLTEKKFPCEKKVTGNRVRQTIRLSSPQDYKNEESTGL